MGHIWFEIVKGGYLLKGPIVIEDTGIKGHQHDDNYIKLDPTGKLVVKPGYQWNGRSGPAIDTADSLRSSAVHDALYQLLRIGAIDKKFRKHADILMRRLDKEDGVNGFRRWYSYWGLRFFGSYD